MSRATRASRDSELLHERARMLASEAIDMELEPADSAWLAQHLEGCDDCRTIAADYVALRNELRSLAVPEPPRDLWARTSAALDEVDRSSRRRGTATRPGFGGWSANRSFIGTAMAVSLVVIISGISLLSQVPGRGGKFRR
jgi:anti-sigma factor RsiW